MIATNRDLEFLKRLDKRCSREITIPADRFYPERKRRDYTDNKLKSIELDRLLSLMNQGTFAMKVGSNGFVPTFTVYRLDNSIPGAELQAEPVLYFYDRQLPRGATWERLSGVFMQPRNRELLLLAGLSEPSANRSTYDY